MTFFDDVIMFQDGLWIFFLNKSFSPDIITKVSNNRAYWEDVSKKV